MNTRVTKHASKVMAVRGELELTVRHNLHFLYQCRHVLFKK